MRRSGWMCCSRTGEMVACCGRVTDRCGWTVDVNVVFCGIWAADGGVCESEARGGEVSGLLTGREGGAV